MSDVAAESVASRASAMMLLAILGVLALMLAAAGIYGVMAHLVGLRTAEIGVRMTLGAKPLAVMLLVLREGLAQAAVGLAIGSIAAVLIMRAFQARLFEISPADPVTLAVVAAILLTTAGAACFIPARRAMRVDPIEALRSPDEAESVRICPSASGLQSARAHRSASTSEEHAHVQPPPDPSGIGRRDFARIAFGTIGAAAFAGSASGREAQTPGKATPGMKLCVQSSANPSDQQLLFLTQLGAGYVSVAAPAELRTAEGFMHIKKRYADAGITVWNIGNFTVHNMPEVTLNLPGRDQKIEEYRQYLRNLGKAGIGYTTYAHMGNGIWTSGRDRRARRLAREFHQTAQLRGATGPGRLHRAAVPRA